MSPYSIIAAVANVWGITKVDLLSNCRNDRLAHARFMLYAALRELAHLSLTDIGKICGGRDHSTVSSGIRRFEQERSKDTLLDLRWYELHARLGCMLDGPAPELPPILPPPEPVLRLTIDILPGGEWLMPQLLDYIKEATNG